MVTFYNLTRNKMYYAVDVVVKLQSRNTEIAILSK